MPSTRIIDTGNQNRNNAITKTVSSTTLATAKPAHKSSAEEIKEKMEQELRLQRAEHHKKRTLEMMHQKKGYLCSYDILFCFVYTQNLDKDMRVHIYFI